MKLKIKPGDAINIDSISGAIKRIDRASLDQDIVWDGPVTILTQVGDLGTIDKLWSKIEKNPKSDSISKRQTKQLLDNFLATKAVSPSSITKFNKVFGEMNLIKADQVSKKDLFKLVKLYIDEDQIEIENFDLCDIKLEG